MEKGECFAFLVDLLYCNRFSFTKQRRFFVHDILMQQMKDEVARYGVHELRTPEDVDATLRNASGTVLVFVNSVCGCAGGIARPALRKAIQHGNLPDKITTVFASGDREATARAREYFVGQPPSSPSFALMKDGRLVRMIHRSDIEVNSPDGVAAMLTRAFDEFCTPSQRLEKT
jgi:putative YphP/YqiW family bacilliredoxin